MGGVGGGGGECHCCHCGYKNFRASKQCYDFQCLGLLACTQMLMRATAHRACTDTIRESALEVDSAVVQELCESRGGRPGLSVLTSLLVSVDVKNY